MEGGKIFDNMASSYGGGVYIAYIVFSMEDGEIFGNTSLSYGGGIFASGTSNYPATVNLKGGKISDNTAPIGGGIYIKGKLLLNGNPVLTGNGIRTSGTLASTIEISGDITSGAAILIEGSQQADQMKPAVAVATKTSGNPVTAAEAAAFRSMDGSFIGTASGNTVIWTAGNGGNSGGDAYERGSASAGVTFRGAPTGTIKVGDSFTVTPNPDDRTGSAGWEYDSVYFSATFNSPATFTALREGSSTISYTTLDGVKSSFTVTVGAAGTASTAPDDTGTTQVPEEPKVNPSTGASLHSFVQGGFRALSQFR